MTFYTTKEDVKIIIEQGIKSEFDFIVRYREPGKRVRTPKHVHLIVDIFMKRQGAPELCQGFLEYVVDEIVKKVPEARRFPPELEIFSLDQVARFEPLNNYGEYSVEFLLVVIELIMIQEKTNYPNGTLNVSLFEKFRDGADIFSVVGAASFR